MERKARSRSPRRFSPWYGALNALLKLTLTKTKSRKAKFWPVPSAKPKWKSCRSVKVNAISDDEDEEDEEEESEDGDDLADDDEEEDEEEEV